MRRTPLAELDAAEVQRRSAAEAGKEKGEGTPPPPDTRRDAAALAQASPLATRTHHTRQHAVRAHLTPPMPRRRVRSPRAPSVAALVSGLDDLSLGPQRASFAVYEDPRATDHPPPTHVLTRAMRAAHDANDKENEWKDTL